MATYLDDPRLLLLVAVHGDEVAATTGGRSAGPAHPPHPRWLAERYLPGTTAQLVRVYVKAEHRRHGLARTLVRRARDFAATTPGYDSIHLHGNAHVEGAEAFWRSMAKEIFDARTTGEHGPGAARCTSRSRCLIDAGPLIRNGIHFHVASASRQPERTRTMAVPKRKMSRSNTRHRRAQWKAITPQLVPITVDGVAQLVPQRLAKAYERGLLRPEG